jgi:hypothetical protein
MAQIPHAYGYGIIDEFAIKLKILFSVISAKAGIKHLRQVTTALNSGFRRSDDSLLIHRPFLEEECRRPKGRYVFSSAFDSPY